MGQDTDVTGLGNAGISPVWLSLSGGFDGVLASVVS